MTTMLVNDDDDNDDEMSKNNKKWKMKSHPLTQSQINKDDEYED